MSLLRDIKTVRKLKSATLRVRWSGGESYGYNPFEDAIYIHYAHADDRLARHRKFYRLLKWMRVI